MKLEQKKILITALLALSIVIVGYLAYRDMLGYFFTATDATTLIDTGRVRSFRDVLRIFNEPLMNGTTLTKLSLFYRPIATLSYSLDYAIWGLNPFGYHLTDLIVHLLVSLSVFLLLLRLTEGKQAVAWLGAVIFTLHPILVESVPAIPRRHDGMAALFLLVSLLLFLEHFYGRERRRVYLFGSLGCYLLALGAKEIAVIFPALIVGYLVIFSPNRESIFARIGGALKSSLPYLVVTPLFLGFRAYIVHGVGGYEPTLVPSVDKLSFLAGTLTDYAAALVYPVSFAATFFLPFPTLLQKVGSQAALLLFFVLLCLYRRALFKIIGYPRQQALRTAMIGLAGVAVFSLIAILAYPSLTPFVNGAIKLAYQDHGPAFLSAAMTNRHEASVEPYFYRAGQLLGSGFSSLIFLAAISFGVLIGFDKREKIKRFLSESHTGMALSFLVIFLFVPLCVYLLTFTFTYRYMYLSVIPFSGILAILISQSVHSTRSLIRRGNSNGFSLSFALTEPPAFALLLLSTVTFSLLAYSPLVRTYGEWKDSAAISSTILRQLTQIVDELPNDAVVEVFNLPERIASYETAIPHVRTTSYLADYSIKSWLDLQRPANRITVRVGSRSKPESFPQTLDLEVKKGGSTNVKVTVSFEGNTSKNAKKVFISRK
jgi:hypothetical protein